MSEIDYSEPRIEGGVSRFDGLADVPDVAAEMGETKVLTPAQARKYVQFIESAMENSRLALAESTGAEDLLAA